MPPRGKTVQLHNMFVADFETCDAWEPRHSDDIPNQKVWLAGYMSLADMRMKWFTSLDDFMLDILARGDNCNKEFAFHNLKFDGSYIVPWLLNNGYTVTHAKPQPKEFSVLIDERNAWYSITIQRTKKQRITIWDSLKLFPTALQYLPNMYGTSTQKIDEGEDFYTYRRPDGHEPTERELSYLNNDLLVLTETLNEHIKLYGLRFKKTQASQSFHNFEKHFPCWKLRFPPLSDEIDEVIRPAYWGGISHVNKKHKGKNCYNVGVYDINSSYPYQLATKKLPYGPVVADYGEGKHPDMSKFWVGQALVRFRLKENKVPCIPTKGVTEGRPVTLEKWLEDSEGVVRLTFSCIDYRTIQDSYHFEVVHWLWSIHWAWKCHREVAEFIHKNNETKVSCKKLVKQEQDSKKRQELLVKSLRAKIDNNSFYGKFGEEVIKRGKTPYLENGVTVYRVDREDIQSEHKRKFLPLAVAVTAWGRQQLVEMVNLLGKEFIYCDTDSIHYFREKGDKLIQQAEQEGKIKIDSTELGAWDCEGYHRWGRYLRAKCYMEGDPKTGVYEVTLAGLPADKGSGQGSKKRTCCTFENFHIGLVIKGGNGKLRTVKTPTGNKLVPTDFEIKEVETLF